MNRAVTLAGRLRHDCDPGIQQIVADQFQIGMPPAKKSREFLLETVVNVVEGLLKSRSRLAINFSNSIFQRLQRITQVGILLIQVLFSI